MICEGVICVSVICEGVNVRVCECEGCVICEGVNVRICCVGVMCLSGNDCEGVIAVVSVIVGCDPVILSLCRYANGDLRRTCLDSLGMQLNPHTTEGVIWLHWDV